jgi:hypothetical protein
MDRSRLQAWIRDTRRTWRWRQPGFDGYEAVEATGDGLRWYRWSHEIADGGPSAVELQSYAHFFEQGPLRPMPPEQLEQLRRWLADHELGPP